ncbi:type IX secretion system sortase PorU [Bacteroidales bacterium OttesenSCG-928-L03]|nr:type IX secretion system sortase PorU [Bacteroidales bacterium OttesenSCG-928-L03]
MKRNRIHNFMKPGLLVLLASFFFSLPLFADNDGSRYAEKSVLSEGKWVMLKTYENAIYKLTYEDIKGMGFSDPAKTRLYGYGGWILNQDFTKPYIDDLPEVSVWVNKGSDGVFNAGDYLLFFGRGIVKWEYSNGYYVQEQNPYSTYGSYFLSEHEAGFKEMETLSSTGNETAGESTTLTVFDDYYLHEKEINHVKDLYSGRELFGEAFTTNPTQSFSFEVPGITSDPASVSYSFAAKPTTATFVTLSVDGTQLSNESISVPGSHVLATRASSTKSFSAGSAERVNVSVSYKGNGVAYLDYIRLNVKRALKFYDTAFTFFRHRDILTKPLTFSIDNAASGHLVWDITGIYDVAQVDAQLTGSSLAFQAGKDSQVREYVMVNPSKSFAKPEVVGQVDNQNLHGLPQQDMIIIAPKAYYSQAERLAERHRQDGLTVFVAEPEWIYNEFASGARDATAYRRFMKMFYDRAETNEEKPRYLLLFGDCIFDNRHLTTTGKLLNPRYYLLSYQIKNSTAETVGTDDYFGFLEDKEGNDSGLSAYTLDVAVGRFPVSSVEQAKNAVDKTIAYMNNDQPGNWKNKTLFLADNTDYSTAGDIFCRHAKDVEKSAIYVEDNHKEFIVYKSYMDAYKPADVNGQTTIPDAHNKFMNHLKEGVLLVQYMGHGSRRALSSENMLRENDVDQMSFEHLPLWITGTCDFGWHDAFTPSGGQKVFLNKNSAGIAIITTTRVVYPDRNRDLCHHIMEHLFSKPNGERLSIGEAFRRGKIDQGNDGDNKLNFILYGDPAMKLNYPEMKVALETINGESVDALEDGKPKVFSFKALDRITLEGSITDDEGNPITDFEGDIRTTVFDVKQVIKSYFPDNKGGRFTFEEYPNMVFSGNDQVSGGRFRVSFLVPLDISYSSEDNSLGKINFYAVDNETGVDANGYYLNYRLSGSNEDPGLEYKAPEIVEMYLNDSSFSHGDAVNATPYFVAKVYDENGINMSGNALGHDITINIDNSAKTTYVLNSYYTPTSNGEGEIRFSIPELPNGEHSLVLTVWNVLNISSRDTITFRVDNRLSPKLYDIIATNVPARENTFFLLEHDRPESTLEVEVFVYDLSGRLVWTHRETGSSGWLRYYPIEWRLVNGSGSRVAPGVYLYSATISAPEGKTTTKAKKMIVLGQ